MQFARLPRGPADMARVRRAVREDPKIAAEIARSAREFAQPIALAALKHHYPSSPFSGQAAGIDGPTEAHSDHHGFASIAHSGSRPSLILSNRGGSSSLHGRRL